MNELGTRSRFILRATVAYAALAAGWIFLSDQLLAVFTDVSRITWLSTVKGIGFVLVTTVLLHWALRAVPDRGNARPSLSLIEAILPGGHGRTPGWVSYGVAVSLSLATLGMGIALGAGDDHQPLLILFMFPIILGALLGGLGPGLLATAVCTLGIAYFGLPPLHSLGIDSPIDLFNGSS